MSVVRSAGAAVSLDRLLRQSRARQSDRRARARGDVRAAQCGEPRGAHGFDEKLGLIDNWLRHVQDVRGCGELNVIEQVVNVSETTVVRDAWARGQTLAVHGWIYDIRDGLLRDLGMCVTGRPGMKSKRQKVGDEEHVLAGRMQTDERPPQPEQSCCTSDGILWDLAAVYRKGTRWDAAGGDVGARRRELRLPLIGRGQYAGDFQYEVKATINSVSTLIVTPGVNRATIPVARIGRALIMLRRNAGEPGRSSSLCAQ